MTPLAIPYRLHKWYQPGNKNYVCHKKLVITGGNQLHTLHANITPTYSDHIKSYWSNGSNQGFVFHHKFLLWFVTSVILTMYQIEHLILCEYDDWYPKSKYSDFFNNWPGLNWNPSLQKWNVRQCSNCYIIEHKYTLFIDKYSMYVEIGSVSKPF